MTQHHIAAQKAIDGLKLNFKSKKARPAVEQLHPTPQTNAVCDCCAAPTPHNHIAAIDSGQRLCQTCLAELRG
jgi:hypothetical protein